MLQLELDAFVPAAEHADSLATRSCVIQRKVGLRASVADLSQEARSQPANSPERNRLYKVIQDNCQEQTQLEALLENDFVPQHSPQQLLSPRAFFVSPLFRVGSKKVARERAVTLQLTNSQGNTIFTYNGPELRQSDGLVFMALLNMTRDIRIGEVVSFQAEDVCRNIFGRYDGPTRQLLIDHVKRLQRALIEFDRFSVQLCMRFDYAARGPWKVALDKDIVQLFRKSAEVWLDFPRRKALPEGLATWLYGFTESQTKLIPMSLDALRERCGSDAQPDSFVRMVRLALKDLTAQQVIDSGWSLKKGMVHWRKA